MKPKLNTALKAKLKKYNLTEDEYNKMKAYSNNTCYICGKPPKNRALAIDHDHRTGKVRGLLCFYCNSKIIGKTGDKENAVELFLKAAKYIGDANVR